MTPSFREATGLFLFSTQKCISSATSRSLLGNSVLPSVSGLGGGRGGRVEEEELLQVQRDFEHLTDEASRRLTQIRTQ